MNVFSHMFLRPGNLWKEFHILKYTTKNEGGYPVSRWSDTGRTLKGVLAEASSTDADRTKHLWDQDKHSLTHTMVVRGKTDVIKGDMLSLGEGGYYVLVNDDVGALGGTSLLYLEERNDVK